MIALVRHTTDAFPYPPPHVASFLFKRIADILAIYFSQQIICQSFRDSFQILLFPTLVETRRLSSSRQESFSSHLEIPWISWSLSWSLLWILLWILLRIPDVLSSSFWLVSLSTSSQ